MEYLDICDEDGRPTGQTVEREVAHREGICHRTAHVWIVRKQDEQYQVLLQKRSQDKDSHPGMYDTSSAGHIPAGCEPLDSALRELEEELGIRATAEELHYAGHFHANYQAVFHDKLFWDHEYTDVFVYEKPVDIQALTLQASEIESVAWFDLRAVWEEIQVSRDRICVPKEGLEILIRYLQA